MQWNFTDASSQVFDNNLMNFYPYIHNPFAVLTEQWSFYMVSVFQVLQTTFDKSCST